MAFKEISKVLSTSEQDIHVVGADLQAIVKLQVANNDASNRTFTVKHYKAADAATIVVRDTFGVNTKSFVELPPITMNEGDKIIALASVNSQVVISGAAHDTAKAVPFAVQGLDGVDPGYPWNFRATTSVAEPSALGDLNFNHGTLGSVTKLVLTAKSSGAGNPDLGLIVSSWDDHGKTANRGRLLLKNRNAPAQTVEFRVKNSVVFHDATIDWYEVDVEYIGGSGVATDAELSVQFFDAADDGAAGITGASALTKVRVVDTVGADPATGYEAGDSVGGVTLVANDLVLRASSSNPEKNGVYPASVSGAASRHADFSTYNAHPGSEFNVVAGTYAGTKWKCTSAPGGTLDSTAITIAQQLAMVGSNNGSEFTDASVVRTNLGLGSLAVMNSNELPTLPLGRLSLSTGVAVPTSDLSGQTSIYYTAANGNAFPLYDGTKWLRKTFAADISLSLDSNSGHTGYHQSGKNFDLFLIDDGGTLRLGTGPAWSSDTARGTGAGTTEIEMKDGLWVNKVSIDIRFGSSSGNIVSAVGAQRALFVGSFRATANGQATDAESDRLLSNAYNAQLRTVFKADTGVSWAYSTASLRQVNGSSSNRIAVLSCLAGVLASVLAQSGVTTSGAAWVTASSGIGIDSSTVNSARLARPETLYSGVPGYPSAKYDGVPGLGYREIRWLEKGAGSDTQTWYGTNSGTNIGFGLQGTFVC